jgi:PAS domain S-box-containing protein
MVYGTDLFLALFQNLAILIALVAIYGYLLGRLNHSHWSQRQVVLGLSFGFFAVMCMNAGIQVYEGVIVDQRNAIVALSGAFGGPLSAVISAAIAGGYRVYLGGDGVIGGIVGITLATLAGIGMNLFSGRFNSAARAALSAFLTAIALLPGFLFIKGRDLHTGWELLKTNAVPYGAAIFLGIFLVGLLLRHEEKRQQAERLFRESEEKYRGLFSNMNEFVVLDELVYDNDHNAVDWRILDVNTAYLKKTGRPREDIVGRSASDIYGAHTVRSCLNYLADVVQRGRPVQFEEYFPTLRVHALISAFHLGGDRFATVTTDITERKRMEADLHRSHEELELRVKERTAELEESHDRFRTLVDLLPEMVFETDARGYYTYANRQMLETFQLSADDLKRGLPLGDFVTDKDLGRARENIRKVLGGEVRQGGEYTVRRKDGTEFPVFVRVARTERGGTVTGLRGIVIDLTEIRKAEAEKIRLEEQLRHSQKMEAVGTLAGGIAHDFNNMLAIILGNAELALDDLLPGDRPSQSIKQIIQASRRARDLVKQILTFSRRTERGKNPVAFKPLLEETFRLLRGTMPSTIRMKLDIQAESATVLADPSQMQQIVVNLVTNAAHAMEENGGLITIGLTEAVLTAGHPMPGVQLPPGAYVILSVQDTGAGISEKVLGRIFEPFFTTKRPGKGTGMGLSVVYGIVKNHEGDIAVESTPGGGSAFNIFLPAAPPRPVAERTEEGETLGGSEHILLVDDEPAVLEMTAEILQGLGYRVVTAANGQDAWKTFSYGPRKFDLVITDQVMPDLTGMALAGKILEVRRDIPVILFTGYSETVSPEQAEASGVSAYVMKPVTKHEVAQTVRRVLERRR